MKGNVTDAVGQFADSLLVGAGDAPTVAIGPLVWNVEQGHDTKHWYFIVGTADASGRFRVDQFRVDFDDQPFAENCQASLIMELVGRRPVVIHSFDDELDLIRFCDAVWPCAKTKRIRASIEQERRT